MKNHLYHYPTVGEMRALEVAAHRARSREILRLIRTAAAGLKGLSERFSIAVHSGGRIGHA
jgi:hypothetical protein